MLFNNSLGREEESRVIGWMKRLGLIEKGKMEYLNGKTVFLSFLLRKVKIENNLFLYIHNLSNLFYSSIFSISNDFLQIFPSSHFSGFFFFLFFVLFLFFILFILFIFLFFNFSFFLFCKNVEIGLVVWITQQIHHFCSIFSKIVFSLSFEMINECIQIALQKSNILLEKGFFYFFTFFFFYEIFFDSIFFNSK